VIGRTLRIALVAGLVLGVGVFPGGADDDDDEGDDGRGRFCSTIAGAQFVACENEVGGDFFTARAICLNREGRAARGACLDEGKAARAEELELCRTQRAARRELCGALGEDRYDPEFEPADFDVDFTRLTMPNPYFPLSTGNRWEYVGGGERVTVEVLPKTKTIEGVTCVVVNDLVEISGAAVEDTDDWFGQRKDGTVAYCGESVRNFEVFAGDSPVEAELVDVGGSWKVGRDGALAGTVFLATPSVGAVYRQEWAPGTAEDAARVLSVTYGFGRVPALDEFVPQSVATRLCGNNDCVVTGEFTPTEPDVFQRKYYARGIGLFLEVTPETGDVVQLVDCNFDGRCAALSAP
jgi:hypothetical protein